MIKQFFAWLSAALALFIYFLGRRKGTADEKVKEYNNHKVSISKKREVSDEVDAENIDAVRQRARNRWMR